MGLLYAFACLYGMCYARFIFSYLDDRLLIVKSWRDMDAALRATVNLDKSLGPEANFRKCYRGFVGPHHRMGKGPQSLSAHFVGYFYSLLGC